MILPISKLLLRRYRFHTAVNRRDQLNKVRNWAVHKTKQETVSTCRMAAHLGMQHQQPDGWAEISAVSSVRQEGFCCWSGFRYSPFLQVLINGLFISRSSYFRSFKKSGGVPGWQRFILYAGAFPAASAEALASEHLLRLLSPEWFICP